MKKSEVTAICCELRANMTDSEKLVWKELRASRLIGMKFRRQHPIFFHYQNQNRFFIADFYCRESQVVIEIDGKIHDKQKEYDNLRDYIMKEMGLRVIRISNSTIFNNRNRLGEYLKSLL